MGKLYVVATPIGNLNDISKRALEVLESCDLIAAEDTRNTQKLLNSFNIKTRLISYHKFIEIKRSKELINKILSEQINIALVSDAGTPCISDPGTEIVRCARKNGIQVIGIAGASALTMALSISGIDSSEISFYGFLSKKKQILRKKLEEIKANPIRTFVVFESPKRIITLIEEVNKIMPNATLCVCNDLTKYYEKSYYGDVKDVLLKLKEAEFVGKGEYTIVGYNNENHEMENSGHNQASIYAQLFSKLFENKYSLKDAINDVCKENEVNKNDVYKAAMELKDFIVEYFK